MYFFNFSSCNISQFSTFIIDVSEIYQIDEMSLSYVHLYEPMAGQTDGRMDAFWLSNDM